MDKKKIVIFGATGSTGIYLTDYLCENLDKSEFEVIAVGRRKTDYFNRFGIKYYSVDITDKQSFEKLPKENIHSIIILAGILPARMSVYKPEQYVDININGTLNIMEYYKDVTVDRVMYMISVSDLHGYMPDNLEFMPKMPIKFQYGTDHTIYAISKTAATEIIKEYAFEFGFKYFIFRLPNIYLYSPETEYYVDYKPQKISYKYMIERAIKGEDIELWGDPDAKREIVYVKDFCLEIYKAILTDADSTYYNIGADCMVTMKEQIEGIIDVFCDDNNKSKIIECPNKRTCVQTHMNIENAREELNYEPKYNYREYLEDYKKEMNSDRFKGL